MGSPQSVSELFSLISGQYQALLTKNPHATSFQKQTFFQEAVDYVYGLWGDRFGILSASELKGAFAKRNKNSGHRERVTVFYVSKPKKVQNISLEDMPLEEQIKEFGLHEDTYF